jgi:hypothetical protein
LWRVPFGFLAHLLHLPNLCGILPLCLTSLHCPRPPSHILHFGCIHCYRLGRVVVAHYPSRLHGLSPRYHHLKALIKRTAPFPSFHDVCNELILEELTLEAESSPPPRLSMTRPSTARSPPVARPFICSRSGALHALLPPPTWSSLP